MEETFETEQEKIVRARTKSLIVSTVLIILNFMGLVFAACYLNSLGYTANYIIDLNQYWQKILKNNYQNKKLPMDSFLVGNLTLIVYCFHQMNLLVLIWQLFFGGIIKRIKFECFSMLLFQTILFATSFVPVAVFGDLLSLNIPFLIFGLVFTAIVIYYVVVISTVIKLENQPLYIKGYRHHVGEGIKQGGKVEDLEMVNNNVANNSQSGSVKEMD